MRRLLGTRSAAAPTHASVMHSQASVRNRAVVRGVFRVQSKEEAAALKLRVVEELTQMAVAGRDGFRSLNDQEQLNVAAILQAFFMTLGPDDKDTLTNAEGCNSRPSGVDDDSGTLYEFLARHSGNPNACGRAFAHDAALWAEHVVEKNPQDAGLQAAWPGQQKRIDDSREAAMGDKKTWWDNPNSRSPRTKNEALYFLAFYAQKGGLEEKVDFEAKRREFELKFADAHLERFSHEKAKAFDLVKNREQGVKAEKD